MPGELRTAFYFYQRKNERHQIAGLCATVRDWNNLCLKEGKLNYDMQAALCREYSDREIYLRRRVVQFNIRIVERAQISSIFFHRRGSRVALYMVGYALALLSVTV
jgi:hypothetical protein